MLAVRSGLPPRRILQLGRVRLCPPSDRRFFVQSLCDGFLDLAIALPFPPSVPPYSATIILVTVASRLLLFPVAVWSRNRVRRLEDVVLLEVERLKPIISQQVLDDMKRSGLPKDLLVPAKLQQIHLSRMIKKVQSERKRLIAEHRCHPFLSMVASPATQLPVFILMSTMFSRLARDPTPFDSEAFLTLANLNHPDPTWAMPIILGMITMANVESNNWLMTAVQRDRVRKLEDQRAQQLAAAGKPNIQVGNVMKTALNALSVARIILAAISPGSVVLYWTTSATCGLIQTWILDYKPREKPLVSPAVVVIPAESASSNPPDRTQDASKPAIVRQATQKRKRKQHSHSW
ncbi:60Kd inner membrane protein-domain-containing protein [Mycena sp. CBHHK59/15]|nr:60Kd inner membrane protein-domain-containing protein [Mycena sp. CBHHK59/15]